jgi:hypothetical protein
VNAEDPDEEAVERLINEGADLNAQDNEMLQDEVITI